MVHDIVWGKAHASPNDILCIGCLENRLSRKLNCTDFPPAPINYDAVMTRTVRLEDRMTRNPYNAVMNRIRWRIPRVGPEYPKAPPIVKGSQTSSRNPPWSV